jgi:hypothetical protein
MLHRYSNLIFSLFCLALSANDVSRVVSYIFDKSPSEGPNIVPAPYYSEDPPPEVGIFILSNHIFFYC